MTSEYMCLVYTNISHLMIHILEFSTGLRRPYLLKTKHQECVGTTSFENITNTIPPTQPSGKTNQMVTLISIIY